MAQQRSHVPKFGNWENEGSVPYTVYFEKARKGRTEAKMINPNDPEQNPDMLSDTSSSSHGAPAVRAEPGESIGPVGPINDRREPTRPVGPVHESRNSKEDSGLRHPSEYRSYQDGSGETNKRTGVAGHSIERSPIHRQAKVSGRESPSLDGKSSYDSSHGTPGRSRMKAGRSDETADTGTAVPKFGAWDESNPSSAEGFTGIFDKVREERQIGAGKVPPSTPPPNYNIKKQETGHNAKCCCFMWSK